MKKNLSKISLSMSLFIYPDFLITEKIISLMTDHLITENFQLYTMISIFSLSSYVCVSSVQVDLAWILYRVHTFSHSLFSLLAGWLSLSLTHIHNHPPTPHHPCHHTHTNTKPKSKLMAQKCCAVLSCSSCLTLCDPMEAPCSSVHGDTPRKNYWSGFPCPAPGDLSNSGIKPRSPPLQVDSLPSEPPRKPTKLEWVAYAFSWESSRHMNWTRVPCIAGRFFTFWPTREAQCSISNLV